MALLVLVDLLLTEQWKLTPEFCCSIQNQHPIQLYITQMELGSYAVSGMGQNWKRNKDLKLWVSGWPVAPVLPFLNPTKESNTWIQFLQPVCLFSQLYISQMELGLHAISGTGQNWTRNDDLTDSMVSCLGSTVLDPNMETNTWIQLLQPGTPLCSAPYVSNGVRSACHFRNTRSELDEKRWFECQYGKLPWFHRSRPKNGNEHLNSAAPARYASLLSSLCL